MPSKYSGNQLMSDLVDEQRLVANFKEFHMNSVSSLIWCSYVQAYCLRTVKIIFFC